ncbi:hypothetical protein RUM44_010556, partial [Polyplax serrata]
MFVQSLVVAHHDEEEEEEELLLSLKKYLNRPYYPIEKINREMEKVEFFSCYLKKSWRPENKKKLVQTEHNSKENGTKELRKLLKPQTLSTSALTISRKRYI